MNQNQRLPKLFEALYEGDPWLDVNLKETLGNMTPEQASKRIAEGRNTIWEIVNHVTIWRFNVLKRVSGEVLKTPDHNYMLPIEDTSKAAWINSLKELEKSQKAWIGFLMKVEEKDLDKIYPINKMSYFDHIHGIIQHDAYHLGQIVLLSKLL